MTDRFLISLSPFVRLVEDPPGQFSFQVKKVNLPLVKPGPGLLAAVQRLAGEGATERQLDSLVSSRDGAFALFKLHFYLDELADQGWLCHAVRIDRERLATSIPIHRDHRFEGEPVRKDERCLLSRFACCRREGDRLVLESPLSRAQVVLHSWRATALAAGLAVPRTYGELAAAVAGITVETARLFVQLLKNAGFLTPALEDGAAAEDRQPSLVQWEFHDLFFHSRSREGRHANPYGGVDRFRGKAERPPLVKQKMSSDVVELYRPDLERLRKTDVSFTEALESRRSKRKHGPRLITDKELGEFLFRCAAVREILPARDAHITRRVYPGGGAAYELDLYLVVNQCRNLRSGLYQYYPLEHQLCRLSERTMEVEWLLENASYTARTDPPQILILISARFQRVTWRYGSMAYATILKNIGGLYQTMYLVATAMGLAPCALGGGHSDMFARATGIDYYEETSVGEFMLGAG